VKGRKLEEVTSSACIIMPNGKKVWKKEALPEEANFIEDGIRPLVVALNQWEKIKTIASCEGHPDHERYTVPYVSFECEQKGLVKMLKERLKGAEWHILMDDFNITPHDAPKGYKTYTLRPNLRGRLAASNEEVTELVKPKDFNPENVYHRLRTFILEYEY